MQANKHLCQLEIVGCLEFSHWKASKSCPHFLHIQRETAWFQTLVKLQEGGSSAFIILSDLSRVYSTCTFLLSCCSTPVRTSWHCSHNTLPLHTGMCMCVREGQGTCCSRGPSRSQAERENLKKQEAASAPDAEEYKQSGSWALGSNVEGLFTLNQNWRS